MDDFNAAAIAAYRSGAVLGRTIHIVSSTESTMDLAKERSSRHPGLAILASHQTKGRGQRGREFLSPAGHGMYLSVCLPPAIPLADVSLITPAAAVSICRALWETCGLEASVKWVNDIVLGGRKVGGILAESSVSKSRSHPAVIVGFGINLTPFDAPEPIKHTIAFLSDFTPVDRNRLAASLLRALEREILALAAGKRCALLQAYEGLLCHLGQTVLVTDGAETYPALCEGIGADGHLIVRTRAGNIRTLLGGKARIALPLD